MAPTPRPPAPPRPPPMNPALLRRAADGAAAYTATFPVTPFTNVPWTSSTPATGSSYAYLGLFRRDLLARAQTMLRRQNGFKNSHTGSNTAPAESSKPKTSKNADPVTSTRLRPRPRPSRASRERPSLGGANARGAAPRKHQRKRRSTPRARRGHHRAASYPFYLSLSLSSRVRRRPHRLDVTFRRDSKDRRRLTRPTLRTTPTRVHPRASFHAKT